jgi:hypothetical protein
VHIELLVLHVLLSKTKNSQEKGEGNRSQHQVQQY